MLLTLDGPTHKLPVTDDDIYDKTDSGRDEMRTRSAGLNQRARSILIMIDGVRSVGDLRSAMARLNAAPDTLEMLAAQGLVVPTQAARARAPAARAEPKPSEPDDGSAFTASSSTDVERFRVAKKFMNDTAVDALGIRSFMFTLKLEKCGTLADLAALAPEYSRLLIKARGVEVAGALRTRLRELLS